MGIYNSRKWNWTQKCWPQFTYDAAALEQFERRFLLSSGEVTGAVRHLRNEEHPACPQTTRTVHSWSLYLWILVPRIRA
ncbi:DUF4172 domain-containing protein [Rhizobium tibeticum]|uniref:DUF4172 domain-containing protein n=1 Tax=Rhizobium tibeticum TaxID=501024 RepID=UPI003B968D81